MDDSRLWVFEESLWTGDADNYREKVDAECLMALPAEPFVFGGGESLAAVIDTPRWDKVRFEDQRAARPQEGLIVIAYTAHAERGDERYTAHCTSTLRRLEHEVWRVVQHSQTVPPSAQAERPDCGAVTPGRGGPDAADDGGGAAVPRSVLSSQPSAPTSRAMLSRERV